MNNQRCAECDCENGGEDCTWIKPGSAAPAPGIADAATNEVRGIADRLRHELAINPALTFADAIEWVEFLANGDNDK